MVRVVQEPASPEGAMTGQPATPHRAAANDAPAWRSEIEALRKDTEALIGQLSSTLTQQLEQLRRAIVGSNGRNLHQSSQFTAPEDPFGSSAPDASEGSPTGSASSQQKIVLSQTELIDLLKEAARPAPTIQINRPPTFNGEDCSKFRSWWMAMESYMSIHDTSRMTDKARINIVGMSLTGVAHEWHYKRHCDMKASGREDRWDEYCRDLRKRFTDPAQVDKDVIKMKELKYNGDIAAYLTRLQDLNLTAQLSGPFLRNLITSNIPKEIMKQALYLCKGKMPEDDQGFLDVVRETGRLYESIEANPAFARKEQSTSAKDQSKSDRRKERAFPSRSSRPSKTRGQRDLASSSSKDQIWSSKKEALQDIAQADIDKRKKANVSCLRCGRNTHSTLNCFAKRDVDGKVLPSAPAKAPKVAGVKRKSQDRAEDSTSDSESEQPAPKKPAVGAVVFQSEEPRIFELSDSDSGTETGFH